MNNQIPYVTASLNDSGMVFKDRILYMVNIRKLRRGILPGILVTVLLAGSNLVFNVSAGTDTAPTRTERTGQEKNTDPEEKNAPDYAPFSEMIDMQKIAGTQSETGVSEDTNTEASVNSGETSVRKQILILLWKATSRKVKRQIMEVVLTAMGQDPIMRVFRQECHTPVASVLLPVWHRL